MLRGNRFQLVTLGRLTLLGSAGDEDSSLAKRRRKLALLTVLAMARRPIPRDTLLAMFWGDQEEARARHSLSNALSSLRRVLGQPAITTRDADVALDPQTPLDVDAIALTEAVEQRDFARATHLYGGHFLDGVYVEGSPDFEQWVSRERRRLQALFLTACANQCTALARARRWDECHALAARWLDAEPLSHDAAIFLLNAIKAPGTRAALADALEEYERLKQRLAREYDVAPERGVRELAESLREQLASITHEHPTPAIAVPRPVAPTDPSPTTTAPAEPPRPPPSFGGPQTTSTPGPSRSPASRRWFWGGLAAATGLATVIGVVVATNSSRGGETAAFRRPVIAVLSMNVSGDDSAVAWLGEGLPQMIVGKLAHNGQVDVVPAAQVRAVIARSGSSGAEPIADGKARDLARRVGATLVARGAITRDAENLVLDVTLNDVGSGERVWSDVLSRPSALALADEAAARILNAANVTERGPRLTELETSSVEAYQHYMRALAAGHAGRLTEWRREIDAALGLDSGFIPVLRARIDAAIGDLDTSLVRRLRETMTRHAHRATPFDQHEQSVMDAVLAGEHERSKALARDLVRRYPRDPRSYLALQTTLSSYGEFEEATRVAEKAMALDSLAIEAGSGPCPQCLGLGGIVNLYWARGDLRAAGEWARRWIRAQPDGASAWAALAWTYSYMQRPDSALPLMQRAVSLSGGDVWATQEHVRMLVIARRHAAADSAITAMESSPSLERREAAADLRLVLERERGRFRAANRSLDRMVAVSPVSAGFAALARADNLRLLGEYAEAARRYETLTHPPLERLALPIPPHFARAFCWQHALAADALAPTGDTLALGMTADTLETGCRRSPYGRDWRLHHHVRGLIAMHGGRFAEAEREFSLAIWIAVEGWGRTIVELAAAQSALDRPRDAIATLRTAYATRLNAMGRYVPISELDYRMARAFAQAGERDSARTYGAYVRNAWRDADPVVGRLLAQLP